MSNRKKLRTDLSGRSLGGRTPLAKSLLRTLDKLPTFKYNGYICTKCDKGFLSIDVDPGTTPMFSPCFATQGCDGQARSMGYPDGDPPAYLGEPIICWYKPDAEEIRKLEPALQQHARRGGLIRKATEAAPDWVKAIA